MKVSSYLVQEEIEEFVWDIIASSLLCFRSYLTY